MDKPLSLQELRIDIMRAAVKLLGHLGCISIFSTDVWDQSCTTCIICSEPKSTKHASPIPNTEGFSSFLQSKIIESKIQLKLVRFDCPNYHVRRLVQYIKYLDACIRVNMYYESVPILYKMRQINLLIFKLENYSPPPQSIQFGINLLKGVRNDMRHNLQIIKSIHGYNTWKEYRHELELDLVILILNDYIRESNVKMEFDFKDGNQFVVIDHLHNNLHVCNPWQHSIVTISDILVNLNMFWSKATAVSCNFQIRDFVKCILNMDNAHTRCLLCGMKMKMNQGASIPDCENNHYSVMTIIKYQLSDPTTYPVSFDGLVKMLSIVPV